MTRTLRIELLGGFRAIADGRAVGRELTTRQQHLVAYLGLNLEAPASRQQIAGTLWPESADAQALTNLRRELHHVRHALPEIERVLDLGSRTVAWRQGSRVELDVVEFDRASDRGLSGPRAALETAVALYRGDLLPGCDDEWIRPERERLRRRLVEVLGRLLDILEKERAWGPAVEQAQRLLRIDPLQEGAWRTLMRAHAGRGERALALHVYHRCVSALKEELGVQPSAATRIAYRELLEVDEAEPAAVPPPRRATYPLFGRQAEWSALMQAWLAAAAGHAGLALVRGQAGIGKTRLVEELLDWSATKGVRSAATRCYAGEGRLAYGPIAAWLQADAVQASLSALEPMWLTEIARLRPDLLGGRTDIEPPQPRLESWQRSHFFEALARVFRSAAPLLLAVDDLQWCDSDTLEWLHFFLRSGGAVRCLVAGTVRSEEEQDNAGLVVLVRELEALERLTSVGLGPLDETATARLAEEVAERPLGRELSARVFSQTEGHPLFIVETGRMGHGFSDGAASVVPPRVQSVVEARLVQLSPDAAAVAGLAAVIGRDFTFDVLAHVSDLEEDALVRAVDELWRRQIVRVQAADRWDFSHDRIREIAYAGVGPARRRLLHRRVAQALEQRFAAGLDAASASIAAHFEQAGHPARALQFFERAGQVAVRLSAYEEAIRCFSRALSLLEHVPAGPEREQRELDLRSALSEPLVSARGYAASEVEANLERTVALAAATARGAIPVRWLWSLWSMRFVLADLKTGRALAEQALTLAGTDPLCACEAHHALAGTLTSVGELGPARVHFEAAIAAYDEQHPQRSAFGSDLGVFAHAWYSHALWLLGEPDAAHAHAEKAIALGERLEHPYSQTLAYAYAGLTYQMSRDVARVRACAEQATALCDQHGFAYYREWALIFLGWAKCQERDAEAGVRLIESGIERLDRQRALARRPYYLSLLAEGFVLAGRKARALGVLDQAIATAAGHGDAWWLPELHRLKGELEPAEAAAASFARAMELARTQGSRALEQRAAASLAGLPARATTARG